MDKQSIFVASVVLGFAALVTWACVSLADMDKKQIEKLRSNECSAIALRIVTRTGQADMGNVVFRECLLQKSV